ncbi:MAG: transketolase [Flavobacteriaceae bacterium]|nr:transketolase [Flavobacteriaceae bacterium]
MRNTFAKTFFNEAKSDERLSIVVADISPAGAMSEFRKEFPNRFINTGVAEQIMIGMVAGMAMQGLKPFAYTIATFSLYRPFEFIRDDLCYQNLPVTIVGIGGGVTYSSLGSTHHAQEDIAIARAVPNLSVIAPCDPFETEKATQFCVKQENGPIYLRLGKAGEPILLENMSDPFVFGKIRYLKRGSDICVVGYGPILQVGLKIAELFQERGKNISIVSNHTLKPMDEEGLVEMLASHNQIIIIEEMSPIGGLSDYLKVVAWKNNLKCDIINFSLKDKFIHSYSSHDDLLELHGLSLNYINSKLDI